MIKENISSKAYSRRGRPAGNLAEGHVREDYNFVLRAGLSGIWESVRGASLVINRYLHSAKPYPAYYKGDLAKSFRFRVSRKGGVVVSIAKHADVIDSGMKPGKMPPYKPIAQWVASKTGAPRNFVKKAEALSGMMLKESAYKRRKGKASGPFSKFAKTKRRDRIQENLGKFAAMVAGLRKKIKDRGIKARNFSGDAMSELADICHANVMKNIDGKAMDIDRLPGSISARTTKTDTFSSYQDDDQSFQTASSGYDVEFT